MCIRRNFSFCVLSPTEVAKELCDDIQVHNPTPLHLWQQISLQLAGGVSKGLCYILMHVFGFGEWKECSERNIFCAGL